MAPNRYTVFFMPFRLAFDVGVSTPDDPEATPVAVTW
jgi:hypothetical protein